MVSISYLSLRLARKRSERTATPLIDCSQTCNSTEGKTESENGCEGASAGEGRCVALGCRHERRSNCSYAGS